jgi:hypothetical protein
VDLELARLAPEHGQAARQPQSEWLIGMDAAESETPRKVISRELLMVPSWSGGGVIAMGGWGRYPLDAWVEVETICSLSFPERNPWFLKSNNGLAPF